MRKLLPLIITSVLSEDELFNLINQGHLPKVQFSLDLSEEERIGRAKVVLPFEHQGVEMVCLFKSTTEDLFLRAKLQRLLVQLGIHKRLNTGEGEIIYFRDSDDEMPDSDEDPDDDCMNCEI
ncbi:ELONGATOR COMPLEX PROTEIN 5 [Salix koriyanagi]|uniref:Elongator complex protein 5 n=1 Tax=Salix koriyanagi TaxID=2511006 RepID=A0A9Q0VSH7_9ROSI|nr:ELONGATOR COMPLEX PROTEIN 5 [Salix koriyanagi]